MKPLLQVESLSKRFGGLKAVDSLSFQVQEGEILGIMGPNGAGKTTVINLVSGIYRADTGSVVFADKNVTGMRPHNLVRRGLVRTFQATVVYRQSTVRENVLRGAHLGIYPGFWHTFLDTPRARAKRNEARRLADELLEWLGLTALAEARAGSLPYGYQKTLGVAVALAARPRLMMLDEPASGLSQDEADHVREVIQRVNASGVSLVVVDHNIRFMGDLCNRLLVMHHGAELAEGTPKSVVQDPKVIEAYLGRGTRRVKAN